MTPIRRSALGWLVVSMGLTACASSGPPFVLTNVTGLLPRLEFQLTNQDNQPVTADDYRGKVVLLYFGYTHCPDACPTTLATLSTALRSLGPQAAKVRVLFVSVDPQRDTPLVLKQYVSFFGTQFVGLRGNEAELTALSKRYRVAFHREPPDRDGNYAVDHSSAIFVFDTTGQARLLGSEGNGAKSIAQDLRRLVAS